MKQLFALAKELGYVLSPLETIRKELSNSISTRFVTRTGVDICRAAAFNLLLITRETGIPSAVPACQTRLSLACCPNISWTLNMTQGRCPLPPALLEARSSTLRWVVDELLPPCGVRRSLAADRTLFRSPSHCCPLIPLINTHLSDHPVWCAAARSGLVSTTRAVGYASV